MKASSCSSILSSALPSSTAGAADVGPVDACKFNATSAQLSLGGLTLARSVCRCEKMPQSTPTSGDRYNLKRHQEEVLLILVVEQTAQAHIAANGKGRAPRVQQALPPQRRWAPP